MSVASGTQTVELDGRGTVKLRQGDYVATGGEGSVWRAGDAVIKLYTDPRKMRRDRMEEKIRRLAALRHPSIFGPEGIVRDSAGKAIGFYGRFASGEPLARVFTTAFRQREKFMDAQAIAVVEAMRDVFGYAHAAGATLVDPNELNWVVDLHGKTAPEPRVFDVDSWAIESWGASVVMPSIRDWHRNAFDALSDWFAWGIVTFQIFTGIHPYRGTLDSYASGDLERRMKDNASVFSSGVRLNRAVRDFGSIPGPLLEWYRAEFQAGERSAPPSPRDAGTRVSPYATAYRAVAAATGVLVFEKLFERVGDPAIRVFLCGAVLTVSGAVHDLAGRRQIGSLRSPRGEVVRVPSGWIFADEEHGAFRYWFVDSRTLASEELPMTLRARQFFRYENRLFLVTDSELAELVFFSAGKPLLAIGNRTAILAPSATHWFDGVGIEQAFGAAFLVLPFGERACITVRTPELDGLSPVAAKAGHRFASIIGLDAQGRYHKVELTFADDYSRYSTWKGETDAPELNLAILARGVCATIVEDGELAVFVPVNGNVNRISDSAIRTDTELALWDDAVVCIRDGAVWKIRMR